MKTYLKYILCTCLVMILQLGTVTHLQAEEMIPMLKEVQQVTSHKIQITYDKPADPAKATDISNYWIQSLESSSPAGIASIGKDQKINAGNALTSKTAKIAPVNGSEVQYEITFKSPITPGAKYKLMICYVSAPGGPQYDGDNGALEFEGQK